ncbi:MAG: hypothetical protein NC489_20745 [Ruminococcus flavefaciens]|nr:hypothetical protein [Ruminococcus flavefaciens]
METSKFELDQKALDRLKRKIVIAENANLRTKNKTDAQMIRDIKKWIEEEVQCCSNQ